MRAQAAASLPPDFTGAAVRSERHTMSDALLVHGFTLGDVHKFAGIATKTVQAETKGGVGDYSDRYDTAWSGIVETLYAADEPPTQTDLIYAGRQAVYSDLRGNLQMRGKRVANGVLGDHEFAPRFAKFWNGATVTQFPEDRILDRMACVQVLPTLTEKQCEAVMALIAHGDVATAARSLGIPFGTIRSRLSAAREAFRTAWFDHETPVRYLDRSETCSAGHPWEKFGRVSSGGIRYCIECRKGYKRRRRAKGLAA